MSAYQAVDGIKAEAKGDAIVFNWQGKGGQHLQAQFSVCDGQPLVQELAARSGGGADRSRQRPQPDFEVTTGKLCISGGLVSLIKAAKVDTPEAAGDGTASTDRTEAVKISSAYKSLRSRLRLNVLVDAEEIVGIVLRFSPG